MEKDRKFPGGQKQGEAGGKPGEWEGGGAQCLQVTLGRERRRLFSLRCCRLSSPCPAAQKSAVHPGCFSGSLDLLFGYSC